MEKEAEEVVAKLSQCRGRRAALEKEVAELEQEIAETDAKLKRYTLDVTAMTEKGEALKTQVGSWLAARRCPSPPSCRERFILPAIEDCWHRG